MTWSTAACRDRAADASVRVIDLLRQHANVERRPAAGSFELAEHTFDGVTAASLDVPAPSRMIWTLWLPERGAFHARVAASASLPAAPVTFRVGISDDRIYEPLARVSVTPGQSRWDSIAADLSPYAGRKWSVFYRPDAHPWRIVLSVDTSGVTTRGVWGEPGIDTDRAAARRFAERHRAAVR